MKQKKTTYHILIQGAPRQRRASDLLEAQLALALVALGDGRCGKEEGGEYNIADY